MDRLKLDLRWINPMITVQSRIPVKGATPRVQLLENHCAELKRTLISNPAPISHRRAAFDILGPIIPNSEFNFNRPAEPRPAAPIITPTPRIDPSDD